MASSIEKPRLERRTTLEYDRSLLCPLMKQPIADGDKEDVDNDNSNKHHHESSRGSSILLDGSEPSSALLSPHLRALESKTFRSALGTAAFKKTTAELAEYYSSLPTGEIGGGDDSMSSLQIRTDNLQRVVDSVCYALEDETSGYGTTGTYRHHCTDVRFEPRGCTWMATVVPTMVEGDDREEERNTLAAAQAAGTATFRVRVKCQAIDMDDEATAGIDGGERGDSLAYVIDMDLLPDPDETDEDYGGGDGSELMVDFGGKRPVSRMERAASFRDKDRLALMKKVFDEVTLDVKKAVVRCEMPEFPEGCKGRTFREIYQLNARLKSGSFATVCRGTHRSTGKKVAIKCVLRKDMPPSDDAAIYDEVSILASLKHRYICPLIDFFEEKECYFLVMELMSGGDLFDRIGKKKSYDESDARDLCKKMLESMAYCHDHSIAHCDMKPKNLLLRDESDDAFIKLADFGFATRVYGPKSLTKQCGTPFFVAPEILLRTPYDQQADMWSVGVIMYLLLSGDLPFMGRSQRELFRAIVVGKYDFPDETWGDVSEHAKELIKGLLVTDPSKRLTAKQAMAGRWMCDRGDLLRQHSLMMSQRRIKTFNARMKLRSAMINIRFLSSTSVWKKNASGLGSSVTAPPTQAIIDENMLEDEE